MPTYGARFRAMRERAGLTQEELVPRLGFERQGSVSNIERDRASFPSPKQLMKHAAALGCKPSELLAGVETEYDRIRRGEYDDRAFVKRAVDDIERAEVAASTTRRRRAPTRKSSAR